MVNLQRLLQSRTRLGRVVVNQLLERFPLLLRRFGVGIRAPSLLVRQAVAVSSREKLEAVRDKGGAEGLSSNRTRKSDSFLTFRPTINQEAAQGEEMRRSLPRRHRPQEQEPAKTKRISMHARVPRRWMKVSSRTRAPPTLALAAASGLIEK